MTLHSMNGVTASTLEAPGVGNGEEVTPVTVVMWPCAECGAQFIRRSKLERHRLSHHSKPRIVVLTPSGLKLSAQQVTLHDSNDESTDAVSSSLESAVTPDSSDVYQMYQLS